MPEDDVMDEYWTASELAQAAGVTPQAIRQAIKDKRLAAKKLGKQWVIPYRWGVQYKMKVQGRMR